MWINVPAAYKCSASSVTRSASLAFILAMQSSYELPLTQPTATFNWKPNAVLFTWWMKLWHLVISAASVTHHLKLILPWLIGAAEKCIKTLEIEVSNWCCLVLSLEFISLAHSGINSKMEGFLPFDTTEILRTNYAPCRKQRLGTKVKNNISSRKRKSFIRAEYP